jgi:hypothetical protein
MTSPSGRGEGSPWSDCPLISNASGILFYEPRAQTFRHNLRHVHLACLDK